MNETPMLFPIAPAEFWKHIRTTIEEVVNKKLKQQTTSPPISHLLEKALLKAAEVCAIFQLSKPTLYDWLKQKKLKSFKIKSRRYFSRINIETIILQGEQAALTKDLKASLSDYNNRTFQTEENVSESITKLFLTG